MGDEETYLLIKQEDLLSLRLYLVQGRSRVELAHYYKSWFISGYGTAQMLKWARQNANKIRKMTGIAAPIRYDPPRRQWKIQKPYVTVMG